MAQPSSGAGSSARVRLAWALGTVGGLGLLRPAPGTWGSAATVLVAWALTRLAGPWAVVALLALALAAGAWACGVLWHRAGRRDPGEVVIDEVAGQALAVLPVAFGLSAGGAGAWPLWAGWLAGFVLFRLFDIWKPSVIGRADRGGTAFSVMADDLLAGAAAAVGVVLVAGLCRMLGGVG